MMEGNDRKSWLMLLLLLFGALASGGGAFLLVSGEAGKLAKGESQLPARLAAAVANLAGKNAVQNPVISLTPENGPEAGGFGLAPDAKNEAAKKKLAAAHLQDGFLPPELYRLEDKNSGGNTPFESSVGMTLTSDVRPKPSKAFGNVDEAMKSGKLRFGPAATRRTNRADPPTMSEGGTARAVPVEKSGLRLRASRGQGKKSAVSMGGPKLLETPAQPNSESSQTPASPVPAKAQQGAP